MEGRLRTLHLPTHRPEEGRARVWEVARAPPLPEWSSSHCASGEKGSSSGPSCLPGTRRQEIRPRAGENPPIPPKAKLGAALLIDKLRGFKKEFDYSEYGGAPILGVKGPVVKMHGSSNANAVKNTILKGIPYVEENVVDIIQNSVLEIEEITLSEHEKI